MEIVELPWMSLEHFSLLTVLLQSELALALTLLALTTALVAFCVPGVIMPLSFSSGALLGGWIGVLVVVTGALLGSQLLFLTIRNVTQARLRARLGSRLERFEKHFAKRGLLYIVGLRLVGTPHFLVTAASALTPLRAGHFAAATLIGFLPVITIMAVAGSAF